MLYNDEQRTKFYNFMLALDSLKSEIDNIRNAAKDNRSKYAEAQIQLERLENITETADIEQYYLSESERINNLYNKYADSYNNKSEAFRVELNSAQIELDKANDALQEILEDDDAIIYRAKSLKIAESKVKDLNKKITSIKLQEKELNDSFEKIKMFYKSFSSFKNAQDFYNAKLEQTQNNLKLLSKEISESTVKNKSLIANFINNEKENISLVFNSLSEILKQNPEWDKYKSKYTILSLAPASAYVSAELEKLEKREPFLLPEEFEAKCGEFEKKFQNLSDQEKEYEECRLKMNFLYKPFIHDHVYMACGKNPK